MWKIRKSQCMWKVHITSTFISESVAQLVSHFFQSSFQFPSPVHQVLGVWERWLHFVMIVSATQALVKNSNPLWGLWTLNMKYLLCCKNPWVSKMEFILRKKVNSWSCRTLLCILFWREYVHGIMYVHVDWSTCPTDYPQIFPSSPSDFNFLLQGPSRQKSQGIQRHCFLSIASFSRDACAEIPKNPVSAPPTSNSGSAPWPAGEYHIFL